MIPTEPTRDFTALDADLIERTVRAHARENFWAFRRWLRPTMKVGWFQHDLANKLQDFFVQWQQGLRPKLVLMAPPQHGKSETLADFMAWVAGNLPSLRTIYATYSKDLSERGNSWFQRTLDEDRYKAIFPLTQLPSIGATSSSGRARNSKLVEFISEEGSFRNTTVRGQITGMGLDFGVLDDPIKGRESVSSKRIREQTWEWFTDDFFTRFAQDAAFIMLMTRWHVDDPVGRFIARFPDAIILRYPAVRVEGDDLYISEADQRGHDEALFPELKDREFLRDIQNVQTNAGWMGLYQQSPIVKGGEMFPIEKFGTQEALPSKDQIRRTVRYWDKAGTEGGGAYTCGVLLHHMRDDSFLISDVRRGQWGALKREEMIKSTAISDKQDWGRVEVYVEQEPGSGGKESAENTIRNLRGFIVAADKVTGSKEIRAEPYAAQVQAGNVRYFVAKWNRDFLDEHEVFPNGEFMDQVDASAGAFMKAVSKKGTYDGSMAWAVAN